MDFFTHQEVARRQTKYLIGYFILAIAFITCAIYAVTIISIKMAEPDHSLNHVPLEWWDPSLFVMVLAVTITVILGGTVFKLLQLRQGGTAIATSLGGRWIKPDTTDPGERMLRNVTTEMALASGLPTPPLYLLDQESGINAFAAGNTPQDAVIGVTRGALTQLSRDQLQGVIAHEFSHIINGDMRLNLRLIGIIHGILLITLIGRVMIGGNQRRHHHGSGKKEGSGLALVGLALLVVGYLGVFCGRMIKAAISRQREFLADAAAVQYTRDPNGIAGALAKIGGMVNGSNITNPRAEEASHMFFGTAVINWLGNLTATHPPLQERITRIAPHFNRAELSPSATPVPARVETTARVTSGITGATLSIGATVGRGERTAPQPQREPTPEFSSHVGKVTAEQLEFAHRFQSRLPASLLEELNQPLTACGVVFALLLDADPQVREQQLVIIREHEGREMVRNVERNLDHCARLAPTDRLPLADLALPGLREMEPAAFTRFKLVMEQLIGADRRVTLFEYALQKGLLLNLSGKFAPASLAVSTISSFRPVARELTLVLSALARMGEKDPAVQAQAYAAAASRLHGYAKLDPAPQAEVTLAQVDAALDRLRGLTPTFKQYFIDACARCVMEDGKIAEAEWELLRAICATLECPVPPLAP